VQRKKSTGLVERSTLSAMVGGGDQKGRKDDESHVRESLGLAFNA